MSALMCGLNKLMVTYTIALTTMVWLDAFCKFSVRARDSLHLTDFVNIMNEASEPENLLLREKVSYQVEMTGSYHTR